MLGRSAPCLHPCSPNTSQHRLCWFPPHPQPPMGWDGKGVSNPGCGEEPVRCSCPWTWQGSPTAGGHSTGDQPRQSELRPCPRSRPHPRCACTSAPPLPRAAIASPALENSAGVAKIRPQHGAPRAATTPWARQSHGEDWEGLDYWSSGSEVPAKAPLCCFPSCSVHIPAAPRLSQPCCSSRQRNTAPCRNQPG